MDYHRRRRGVIAAVGFRLLLALSLWQGPIPWGHLHNPSDPGLGAHLARYHQPTEGLSQSECLECGMGWHWHFSLPDESEGGEDAPARPPYLPTVEAAAAPLGSGSSFYGLMPWTEGGELISDAAAHDEQRLPRARLTRGPRVLETLCRLSC